MNQADDDLDMAGHSPEQVRGELARERIASQTARDEAAHWKDVACRLQEQIDGLKRKRGEKA